MIQLFHADCLDKMKDISSNSIDLVICDLPYGCLEKGCKSIVNKKSKCYLKQEWDTSLNLEEFWNEIKRIVKDKQTPILMFCSMRFFGELMNSNPKWFQYGLVWKKNRGTNYMDANRKPLNDFELIAVFGKQRPFFIRKDGRCMTTTLEFNIPTKKQHPTEKPIELYKFLIERYCPEGGSVLDPTFGSCNSGLACKELKRNYIGIEKDKGFFEKAKEKIYGKDIDGTSN